MQKTDALHMVVHLLHVTCIIHFEKDSIPQDEIDSAASPAENFGC